MSSSAFRFQLSDFSFPSAALWRTADGLGDIDTNCAIVGGIVAARVGRAGLPAAWLARCEPLPGWAFGTTQEGSDTMKLHSVIGDATAPQGGGARLIVHVCNDVGGWGRGFVLALSRRWPEPERRYRAWYRGDETTPFALGAVQFVAVEEGLWVANLIGQHGVRARSGIPPVRYEAIREGLRAVAGFAREHKVSVHMPRIGAGLAGGSWAIISAIIEEELVAQGVAVTVYDLPS